jgi:hypothetical protein
MASDFAADDADRVSAPRRPHPLPMTNGYGMRAGLEASNTTGITTIRPVANGKQLNSL